MFRRVQPIARKEEVDFPIDLTKLGYVKPFSLRTSPEPFLLANNSNTSLYSLFINDKDQLRQIEKPDTGFEYHIHKNERVNERRREAVDGDVSAIFSSGGYECS